MNSFDQFVVAILAQVTLITLLALILIRFARRSSSVRHAVGVVGLVLVVGCPPLVLALPRPVWLRDQSPMTTSTSISSDPVLPKTISSIPAQVPMTIPALEKGAGREDVALSNRAPIFEEPARTYIPDPLLEAPSPDDPATPPVVFGEPAIANDSVPSAAVKERISPSVETVSPPRTSRLSLALTAFGLLWGVGMFVAAIREWIRRRELRVVLRSSSVWASERLSQIAEEVCAALGLSELPPIRVSDLAPLPFLLGIWKPVVVMPRKFVEIETTARLRDVLIHECAHVTRKDPWVHLLQRIAAVMYWFHPGVHALNKQIGRAREELCDNFVLQHGNAADYAETLFELSESCRGQRLGLSVLGLFSPRWTLEQRIGDLLDPGRSTITRTRRRTVAVLVLGFGSLSLWIGGLGLMTTTASAGNQSAGAKPVPDKQASDPLSPAQPKDPNPADLDPVALNPGGVGPLRRMPNRAAQVARKISVVGKCVDDDGQPVAGARLRIIEDKFRVGDVTGYGPDPVKVIAELASDDEGRFTFKDIPVEPQPTDPLLVRMLYVTGSAEGRASAIADVYTEGDTAAVGAPEVPFVLSSARLSVSGIVTDSAGKPLAGAHVFMGTMLRNPIPGMWSSVTDRDGRYTINDLERWKSTVTEGITDDGTSYTMTESNNAARFNAQIHVLHPNHAIASQLTVAVPGEVNITLQPAAILTGHVADQVTGRPADSVVVVARGIAGATYVPTRTDGNGRYRLQLSKDHYNIWAEADDRIAAVLKAVAAEVGKPAENPEIRLVRGGFVVGTVIDDDTNQPIASSIDSPNYIGHYGPASIRDIFGIHALGSPQPNIGALQDTKVNPDGTFRLRVAPGRNAIFFQEQMGDIEQSPQIVTIEDGHEKQIELHVTLSMRDGIPLAGFVGKSTPIWTDEEIDADMDRFSELRQQAKFAEAEVAVKSGTETKNPYDRIPSRERRDSQVNRLLDQFERLSIGKTHLHDPWLQAIKDIVDLGPAAVPELIEELDATNDLRMLQMLGFALRAINDRRAVPALIRAIPKTLPPVEPEKRIVHNISDFAIYRHAATEVLLTAKDPKLAEFAVGNAISFGAGEKGQYMYHGSVREICGALTKLTGARNGEEELFDLERYEATPRYLMPVMEQLFPKVSNDWTVWWGQHQNDEFVVTPASPNEANAIETIKKFGGQVTRDGAWPGRPVASIFLDDGRTRNSEDYLQQLNVLKEFPGLQVLSLLGNENLPAGGMKIIAELHSLIDVRFGDTNFVGRSTLSKDLKEIRGLTNLKKLDFIGCQLTNEDLKEIAQHRGLTKLRLSGNEIDDAGVNELRQLQDLEELQLSYAKITDAGLADLAELKNLKKLEIQGAKVTDVGLKELRRLTKLISLDISNTKIKGVGFSELKQLQNLRWLNLDHTRVNDSGAKAIAELRSLTSLKMKDTKITDEGLKEFRKLQNLRYLVVEETDVSKVACAELEKAVSYLQVDE